MQEITLLSVPQQIVLGWYFTSYPIGYNFSQVLKAYENEDKDLLDQALVIANPFYEQHFVHRNSLCLIVTDHLNKMEPSMLTSIEHRAWHVALDHHFVSFADKDQLIDSIRQAGPRPEGFVLQNGLEKVEWDSLCVSVLSLVESVRRNFWAV